jgi:tetratricopeptide (TPR) repeat protein
LGTRKPQASRVQKRSARDRRLISAGIGLGLALLLIGAAFRAHRAASGSGADRSAPARGARTHSASGAPPTVDPQGAGARASAGATGSDARERSLLDAVARQPKDARAREQLGTFYVETGRPFEGLWELQEALSLDPDDLPTRMSVANALAAARCPDEALTELRALLVQYPGRVEVCRRLADLYLATGRPKSAVAALRQARDLHRSPEALLVLGRACESLNRADEAERALHEAQQLLPAALEPYLHLGWLYLHRSQANEAEHAFLAARVLAPAQPEPRYGLGLTYQRRARPGDRARAEAELRAAIQLDPEHVGAQRDLGRLLLARRQYHEAGEHFLQALRATNDAEACRGMAEALGAVGRRVEAQYHWGLYYTRKDLRPRAAAAFQAMAALEPERTEAVLLLSETYFRMKQQERGVKVIEAALRHHPRDAALYERLAALYVALGNHPAARRVCQAWLRVHPNAAAPHWVLGKMAVDSLRVEEGVRELERAVGADPGNAEFAHALAVALLRRPSASAGAGDDRSSGPADHPRQENQQRAVQLLEAAIQRAPDVARYRSQLGLTLRQQGDLEGARQQLLRSLDLDPHEASVYSNLVSVSRQLRRPDQVRFWSPLVRTVEDRTRDELRLWRSVWDRPTDQAAYYRLAEFLIRTGDLSKAESQLQEALRLRPRWPEARQALEAVSGVVHVRSG